MTEFELIAKLTEGAPREARDLAHGVGDDCAVIAGPSGRDWLVTADALIEGVHFRREWTDLASLGKKAMAANLSDIASMGGVPRFYIVSLAVPDDLGAEGALQLYAGMRERARASGALLIGGDTSASRSGLLISIAMLGEIESGRAILRSGARPGDAVYVTGTSGSAALGLACLESGRRDDACALFVRRHLDPEPRLAAGEALMKCGMVSAMIDSSDGLMADLSHIAEASGVGFEIEDWLVPREPRFDGLSAELGLNPAELVLSGGEDYELIFTVRSEVAGEFDREIAPSLPIPVSRIGKIVADRESREVRSRDGKRIEIAMRGFDHFASRGK